MRRGELRELSTGVLRAMERWVDSLPLWLMPNLRVAVKEELLARSLCLLADESGGHVCAAIRGHQ